MGVHDWERLAEDIVEPAWRCGSDDRVVWLNAATTQRCGRPQRGSEAIAALSPFGAAAEQVVEWLGGLAGGTSFTVDVGSDQGGWLVRAQPGPDGWSVVAIMRNPAPPQLLDAVTWPMAWIDGAHRYRYVNRAYEAWFRRPADRVIGRTLASLMGEERYQAARARLEDVRRGEPMSFASELPFPDGRRRHVEVTFLPDRPVDRGLAEGFLVVVQDTSERQHEHERQAFVALSGRLIAAASDLDSTIDQLVPAAVAGFVDWCIVRWADGRTVERARPTLVIDPARLDEAAEAPEAWMRTVEPREDGLTTLVGAPIAVRGLLLGSLAVGAGRRLDERDRQVVVEVAQRIAAAIDGSRAYASAKAARRQAEQAVIQLAQQAAALAESNAQVEQFASIASHDLQEPLRMVTQYLGLLERRYGDGLEAKAREYLANASDGAARMQVMIGDLLAYSRAGRGEPACERVECAAVLAEVLRDLDAPIAEANATIISGGLPDITGDRTRLARVLHNLIANALKFRRADTPVITVTAAKGECEWRFAVHDNGIGIDPAHHQRIFDLFQRLHLRDEYPGTGIGLAICRKLVEQVGGRIWVESQPGSGATFIFTLPIIAPAAFSSTREMKVLPDVS